MIGATAAYPARVFHSSRPLPAKAPIAGQSDLVNHEAFDRDARQFAIDQARASSALEGQRSSDQAHADQDAYVRGEISIDELICRAHAEVNSSSSRRQNRDDPW